MSCRNDHPETFRVSSVGYDGTIYVFPPWEDGSLQIMAATGTGNAVQVRLDREGAQRLAEILSKAVIVETEIVNSSR